MDPKLKSDCLVAIGDARRRITAARKAKDTDAVLVMLTDAIENLATVLVHVVDQLGPSAHAEAVATAMRDAAPVTGLNHDQARDRRVGAWTAMEQSGPLCRKNVRDKSGIKTGQACGRPAEHAGDCSPAPFVEADPRD